MDAIRGPYRRFVEEFEPLRPDLYRYCRHLCASPWDAEDLVQDALLRAFVTLATRREPPRNPRAWLFRVASNRWLNQVRDLRARPGAAVSAEPSDGVGGDLDVRPPDTQGLREAAGSLVTTLSPQERASVVLKDVFGFSLAEVGELLGTTTGAVKAALHRARGRLREPVAIHEGPAPQVVEAFCEAFNAGDLERLMATLLDTTQIELVGTFSDQGLEVARRAFGAMLFATDMAMRAAILERYRGCILSDRPRFELAGHRGQAVLLTLWNHEDGWAVRGVSRLNAEGDRITAIKTYLHAPELIEEVARECALPFRTNGYRDWECAPHDGAHVHVGSSAS